MGGRGAGGCEEWTARRGAQSSAGRRFGGSGSRPRAQESECGPGEKKRTTGKIERTVFLTSGNQVKKIGGD
jgi:hypothetical protein